MGSNTSTLNRRHDVTEIRGHHTRSVVYPPEAPTVKNPHYSCLLKELHQSIVPDFFRAHPDFPHDRHAVAETMFKIFTVRHAQHVIKIDNWRQRVSNVDDDELIRDREAYYEGYPLRAIIQPFIEKRARRERVDMTAYVNGECEAVERERHICWKVLIAGSDDIDDATWKPDLKRTDSVEALESIPDLV
ncbi:MAG: hypothetical protein Q9201_002442 [Fulgogasparrea decipioides]